MVNLSLLNNRLLRFLVMGVINTLFAFAAFSAAVLAGAEIWLALLLATIAGIIFNFFTTGGYVFRQLSPGRFLPFAGCYVFVYAVNYGLLDFLSRSVENKILLQFMIAFPQALLSYVLMSRLVFTDKKPPEAL